MPTEHNRLAAFKLGLPSSSLDIDTVTGWLDTIAATTHPPRFAIIKPPPLVVELVATNAGIAHYLIFPARQRRMVLAGLRAALPVRLADAADYPEERPAFDLAAELHVRQQLQRVGDELVFTTVTGRPIEPNNLCGRSAAVSTTWTARHQDAPPAPHRRHAP